MAPLMQRMMQRKRFLSWLAWGGLGQWLAWITGCSNNRSETAGFAKFASILEVEEARGAILRDYFAKDPILLVQDPIDKTQYRAVNATCSHQRCLINWNGDRQAFVCPCHGSTFGTDGKVLQGPAKEPLQTFATRVKEKDIYVKV
jgi:cytochrome b6-f complex iron-sulfur subunit